MTAAVKTAEERAHLLVRSLLRLPVPEGERPVSGLRYEMGRAQCLGLVEGRLVYVGDYATHYGGYPELDPTACYVLAMQYLAIGGSVIERAGARLELQRMGVEDG